MLSGNYFVTLATPSLLCDDNEDTNVGLLSTLSIKINILSNF